ncbi:MAG: 23S rRNA (pseudouridine(1915)-N(3))-methyltransferase RlmH [Lachnospiraceae bacterium]|nr:23S rRNA (pseudouridine(1915)-N(3))-methyltransferase RlmH [Lachnospiraceae bacterium]
MKIKIICVGKIKEKYLEDGIRDFSNQLKKHYDLEMIELPDEKTPQGASLVMENKIKEAEGKRILSKMSQEEYIFALCIDGKQMSTETLSKKLHRLEREGTEIITFLIGGSLGLSDEVVSKAKEKISFSAMTFPHQLMRLILMEQLAAAFSL